MTHSKNFFKAFSLSVVSLMSISSCQSPDILPIEIQPVFQEEVNVFKTPSNIPTGLNEWGEAVKNLPKSKKTKKYTYLSYVAFDNNKESSTRRELKPVINIHEMAGSNDDINQVILTDGDKEGDIKRYYIVNEKTDKIKSPYISTVREKDTASYSTLSSFIKWGFNNYPGQTKILDINSHGVGFSGIVFDNTSDTRLSIPDFAKAIKTGVGKVDILNLDACLMSSVEVVYELKDLCEIIVSSEDNTLRTGMKYVRYLPEILKNSKNNTQIAEAILEKSDRIGAIENDGKKGVKNADVPTISAIRASDVDRLVYHLNTLSRMLLNRLDIYKDGIKAGIANTHPLEANSTNFFDGGQRDLYEVIARIEIELNKQKSFSTSDIEIKQAIQTVREDANRAIIRARNHKDEKWAEGIAINISPDSIKTERYKSNKFAKDNLWDDLILQVYR